MLLLLFVYLFVVVDVFFSHISFIYGVNGKYLQRKQEEIEKKKIEFMLYDWVEYPAYCLETNDGVNKSCKQFFFY